MSTIDLAPTGEGSPPNWVRLLQLRLCYLKLTLGCVLYVCSVLAFAFRLWAGPDHWIDNVPTILLVVSIPVLFGKIQLPKLESLNVMNIERHHYLLRGLFILSFLGVGIVGLLMIRGEVGRELEKAGFNPGPLGLRTDITEAYIDAIENKEPANDDQ